MKRCAIYLRVSTEDQAEKYGLPTQRAELVALAARRGDAIVEEFSDDGVSGATLERPALLRLRDAVRARRVDMVLVHTLDRLSRDLGELLLLWKEWERHGVTLDALDGPIEQTPTGRMLVQVKGMVAEYERAMIRERTMRGKRERARRGLWQGAIPFGYRKLPSGHLEVDDRDSATVRLIFRLLVDEARTLRAITVELRRLGCPTRSGKPWNLATVSGLVRNPTYLGTAYFQQRQRPEADWIAIPVPALIAPAIWEAARRQLARNRTVEQGRPPRSPWLLRGLLRCGRCGRRLVGLAPHRQAVYYRCPRRDTVEVARCGLPVWAAARLDHAIWAAVVDVLRRPDVLLARLTAYRTRHAAMVVDVRAEAEEIRRELAEVTRQEARLLDAYLDEALQVPVLRERLSGLGVRRAALHARLAEAERRAKAEQAAEGRAASLRAWCAEALRGLEALDLAGRRRLLLVLVDMVVVRDAELELHGVLPAGNCRPDQGQAESSRYTLLIPVGLGGRP